jgi:hypothetical protein
VQLPGFALDAAGADEALGPARREQVSDAGRLIREALLELDQGTGKVGHLRHQSIVFVLCSNTISPHRLQHFAAPGHRGISLSDLINLLHKNPDVDSGIDVRGLLVLQILLITIFFSRSIGQETW